MTVVSFIVSFSRHGPLTRYVKRRVAHVSGMTGTKPPSGYTSNCVNKANLLFKRIWMLCYRSFRTACEFYGLLDTSTYFKLDESRPVSVTSTLLRVTSCLEFSQNLCLKFVNTVTKQKNLVPLFSGVKPYPWVVSDQCVQPITAQFPVRTLFGAESVAHL